VARRLLAARAGPRCAPGEALRLRVRPALEGVGDPRAEQGRELERVAAPARGDDEPLPAGIAPDEEVLVRRVAVEAEARRGERRVGERGQDVREKPAEAGHVPVLDSSLVALRIDRAAGAEGLTVNLSTADSVYAGAVGYFGADGDMDVAIALRTAVIKEGRMHVQAGGGVVHDSDPAAEFEETVHKSNAIRRAAADAARFGGGNR